MRLKSLLIVFLLIVDANITFSFQISKTWGKKIGNKPQTASPQQYQQAKDTQVYDHLVLSFFMTIIRI
jgi:hypothetical protein